MFSGRICRIYFLLFFALFPRKISAVFSPGGDLPVSVILVYFFRNVNCFLLEMFTKVLTNQ